MSLDQAAWGEIARLWQTSAYRLGQIAKRYGISHQKITARARAEGWPPRECEARATVDSAPAPPTRPNLTGARRRPDRPTMPAGQSAANRTKRQRTNARRQMVERLFDAMDTKLSSLEARIAAGGDATPADSERTTRSLNTLVRSLEKLTDYEGKLGKTAGRRNGKQSAKVDDAERRRTELAKRIQRLLDSQ